MQTLFAHFLADETGAVSIEHSVVASSIAVAIAAVIGQIDGELRTPLETVKPGMVPN